MSLPVVWSPTVSAHKASQVKKEIRMQGLCSLALGFICVDVVNSCFLGEAGSRLDRATMRMLCEAEQTDMRVKIDLFWEGLKSIHISESNKLLFFSYE